MCEIKDNKMTNLQQECFIEVDYSVKNIAVVKINRPEAKNALNTQIRKDLARAFNDLSFNDDIHAIVLTGGDSVFAAGADLKEMANATSTEMLLRHTERYWNAIAQCPKPIIAAVNGFALGVAVSLPCIVTLSLPEKVPILASQKLKWDLCRVQVERSACFVRSVNFTPCA